MSITIEWADWINPDNGKTVRIKAADYNKERDGGTLMCPHPGCTCELKHVPEHKGRGSIIISAHFARKTGKQVHNRTMGCIYPNSTHEENAKARAEKANKIINFFESTGQKYIYLNNPFPGTTELPQKLRTIWRHVNNHPTATQSDNDATFSVKTAKDWERLRQHKSFGDPFYKDAFVVSNSYTVPFAQFQALSHARLIKIAAYDVQHQFNHMVLTEVTPLPGKTEVNHEKGVYFIKCKPQAVKSKKDNFTLNIQPVIATSSRALAEEFNKHGDDKRFLVWASGVRINPAHTHQQAEMIRDGLSENNLPVTLLVNDRRQFVPL